MGRGGPARGPRRRLADAARRAGSGPRIAKRNFDPGFFVEVRAPAAPRGGRAGEQGPAAPHPCSLPLHTRPVPQHFVKDMGIALAEAKRLNLSLPGLALAHQLCTRARPWPDQCPAVLTRGADIAMEAQGHGRKGTQGLLLALEKLNGMERPE